MYVENQGPAYDFFLKPTALPVLPPPLTRCVLNYNSNHIITRSTDRLLRSDRGSYANAQITRHPVERQLSDWINDNISGGFTDVSVQVVDRAAATGAHTDKLRRFLLFYLVEPGGHDVITKWFRQKGHPLWRDQWITFDHYDDLEVVHETRIPCHQWFLFNARIIHDVQNLLTKRLTLAVGFNWLPAELETLARSECLDCKEHSANPRDGYQAAIK